MIDVPLAGRLAGKVVLVSGAGQTPGQTIGNGKAIALLCARAGARVICLDRDESRAIETAQAISDEGGRANAVRCDISSAEDVARMMGEIVQHIGRLDGLVNNVGIGGHGDAPVDKVPEDTFDLIMKVNLKGALLMTQAALAVMREKRSGSIVNISSLASIAGSFQTGYELSKAAMNRMTESVALANAKRQIRCNAVLPGLMDTPMAVDGIAQATGRPVEEVREMRAAQVPLGHMGNAWDVAHATLFLLSDEARFITGTLLRVDGGQGVRIG